MASASNTLLLLGLVFALLLISSAEVSDRDLPQTTTQKSVEKTNPAAQDHGHYHSMHGGHGHGHGHLWPGHGHGWPGHGHGHGGHGHGGHGGHGHGHHGQPGAGDTETETEN